MIAALADGWGLTTNRIEHLPVGAGSYHWLAVDGAGKGHFVTVDDLDQKTYLGPDRDSAFERLRCALDTAHALRRHAGLEFVVAPLPTPRAETVRRIGSRHAATVYPFVQGTPPGFGAILEPNERVALVRMLARLHEADPAMVPFARQIAVALPARRSLERALGQLDVVWSGGPFSEPTRALLAEHAAGIRRLLETFDELADRVEAAGAEPVVTHGEPHGGNIIRAGGRLLLIDWDTVGFAPRERDLWMLATANAADLELYSEVSGRSVDQNAVTFYKLRWQLDDISLFIDDLRAPHERSADTEHWWVALVKSMPL